MKLSFKEGRADKVHIFIDGEYEMTVDSLFVSMLKLEQNMELDDEKLAELKKRVSFRRAFNKACDLLEMRDHSSRELLVKLRQKGFGEGAEEALEKLEELGIVDDLRFAKAYKNELVQFRHFGKKRVISELFKKGIDRSIIDEVTEDMETDTEELKAIIRRKYLRYLSDEKGKKRTVNALIRMGYSYSEINEVLTETEEEEE